MARTRISTTVDSDRLAAARAAFDLPDSQLVDRAIQALLDEVATRREREAILAQPYDEDDDLSWSVGAADPLPYDGDVPTEVEALARERRARYAD